MATTYTVAAPLVQVQLESGAYAHVYQGAPLPDDADADHVKLLVADGMVVKGEYVPEPQRSASADAEPASDGKPAGNASLEEWQDYARSQGATDADLEGVSRNELRDRYV